MTRNVSKTLDLEFTHLEFYSDYVISTVKEDSILEEDHLEKLMDVCVNHFEEKPFVYIANRKFNYNVNPLVYLNLFKIETLEAIAVASDNKSALKTAIFEKHFSRIPFEIFHELKEAQIWAERILNE